MKYYTLQDVLDLNPCHAEDILLKYMKGRKRISLSGILNSPASDPDKIWLVARLIPLEQAVAADDAQVTQLKLIIKEHNL